MLSKATCELQAQGLSSTDAISITSEETNADWQAVWAYALGSELELSSLLRSDKNYNECPQLALSVVQSIATCYFNGFEMCRLLSKRLFVCCASVACRAAMEDSNPAVLIACAKSLHAILSCSPNESVFDIQEVFITLSVLNKFQVFP